MNSVYIEITSACNLRCSFCPCPGLQEHGHMERSLFFRCLDEVHNAGIENVYFHVLGEPTLHPDFNEFLEALKPRSLRLTLTTNGTTIQKSGDAILECPQVRQINFSTHAYAELPRSQAEMHLKNVLDFCEKALARRPDLYINLRLWNVGASDSASWNSAMLKAVNGRFKTAVQPGHFCSRHKSFNVTGRLYLHEDSRFEWPEEAKASASNAAGFASNATVFAGDATVFASNASVFSGKTVPGTCRALDTHVAILHDGRAVACCLDYSGQITLGQIQRESLRQILSSPAATALREGFAHHELLHPFCQHCTFCRRFK